MYCDCIILGGGAAGLAACAALAGTGMRIALIERLDRVGKKLLAAGNGRCNISNENMDPGLYGDAEAFVRAVYKATPPEEVLGFFSSLGLMTAAEDGRIYPRTMMAASVLDVLRAGCSRENVTMMTGQEAVSLSPSRRGGWCVQLAGGEGVFAPAVLLAAGGSAAPHLGTDGAGTRLLAGLGHRITPLYPSLVQLRCNHGALRSLKGIRVQAQLTLEIDGMPAAQETGEMLFADYGISGVCVFQLSGLAAAALDRRQTVRMLVHLLPEICAGDLHAWLCARIHAHTDTDMQSFFTGVFPRLLAQAVIRQAGLSPDRRADSLTAQEQHALIRTISAFPLPVTGTQGFKNAQVTRGGAALDEVCPDTMQSRLFDRLYLAGEVLDADGPCGGYNLHFAFAGGLTAAKAIAQRT